MDVEVGRWAQRSRPRTRGQQQTREAKRGRGAREGEREGERKGGRVAYVLKGRNVGVLPALGYVPRLVISSFPPSLPNSSRRPPLLTPSPLRTQGAAARILCPLLFLQDWLRPMLLSLRPSKRGLLRASPPKILYALLSIFHPPCCHPHPAIPPLNPPQPTSVPLPASCAPTPPAVEPVLHPGIH